MKIDTNDEKANTRCMAGRRDADGDINMKMNESFLESKELEDLRKEFQTWQTVCGNWYLRLCRIYTTKRKRKHDYINFLLNLNWQRPACRRRVNIFYLEASVPWSISNAHTTYYHGISILWLELRGVKGQGEYEMLFITTLKWRSWNNSKD